MATDDRSGAPFVVVAVAIAGLLSTLGAAALSGYWTNASVERQFDSQRTAQIQDLRRQVYVDFLQRTTEACIAGGTEDKEKIDKAITSLLSVLMELATSMARREAGDPCIEIVRPEQ